MKQIAKMSDRELAQSARDIAKETADRANRKAAAQAILAVLKKHIIKWQRKNRQTGKHLKDAPHIGW